MKKPFFIVIVLIVVAFFIILSTAIDTSKENSIKVSGTVKSISEGGIKDVVFELDNNKTSYYINRGFENGFELAKAKKDFEGKKLHYFMPNPGHRWLHSEPHANILHIFP